MHSSQQPEDYVAESVTRADEQQQYQSGMALQGASLGRRFGLAHVHEVYANRVKRD